MKISVYKGVTCVSVLFLSTIPILSRFNEAVYLYTTMLSNF